jgi:23S rRNA (adenine2503-C2)-methyltransferase
VFVEYLLLDGVNDSDAHARELTRVLRGAGWHVNLIAYNPTDSRYVGSPDPRVRSFAATLERGGLKSTYRVSRGRDISAACGQLAAPVEQARRAARARRQRDRQPVAD